MTQEELDQVAEAIGQKVAICHKEVLTLEEAALYTGMEKSYLYKLTASQAIPHYKPTGKKCYFRRHELEQWLTSNPIATSADLNGAALAYCMKH